MPCPWGAAAFLAPGRMTNPGLPPVLLPLWALAVFAGCGCEPVSKGRGSWGCRSASQGAQCSAPLALPWNMCLPVPTSLVCSSWPDILSRGLWDVDLPPRLRRVRANAGPWPCLAEWQQDAFRTVLVPCRTSSNAFSQTPLNNH